MRVPDISFTVTNCTTTQNAVNKTDEQQTYSRLNSTNELYKLESNEEYRKFALNESNTYSSADEFVRRALNSTDMPAITISNSNENPSLYTYNATSTQLFKPQSNREELCNTSNNFCIFNTDCNKKFLQKQNEGICLPIPSSDNRLSPCSNANDEKQQNVQELETFTQDMINSSSSEESVGKQLVYSKPECNCNDFENYSNENQSDYGEDDVYLTSISSSSDSLKLSKYTYFPRGIVNPNYPGFQHLAHTLSEDIVRSPSWISYDSDTSDYEMDLSDDSCDSIPNDSIASQIFNNNNSETMNEVGVHLKGASNHVDSGFQVKQQSNHHQFEIESHSIATTEGVSNPITMNAIQMAPIFKDNKNSAKEGNILLNINTLGRNMESVLTLEENAEITSKNSQGMPTTPDILMENWNTHRIDHELKKENRPDLLCGVTSAQTPNTLTNSSNQITSLQNFEGKLTELRNETDAQFFSSYSLRDEISLGLTPVDIIGDFGQEVEREFGLLVSGYKRETEFEDDQSIAVFDRKDKLSDAVLSLATDQLDTSKYLEQFSNKHTPYNATPPNDIIHDNAVDIPDTLYDNSNQQKKISSKSISSHMGITENFKKPIYNKSSYDERQLPPVAIEYKKCHQNLRNTKKSQLKPNLRIRTHTKSIANGRQYQYKRTSKMNNNSIRKQNEEFHQYQKLLNDKDEILNKSKYAKVAPWAQYLNDQQTRRNSADLLTPSALELFEAYKIGDDIDQETLQKHLHLAKEIEKKRRSDREEIRRRLAKGAENYTELSYNKPEWNSNLSNRLQHNENIVYDTETNSSDSETCPKLSRTIPTAIKNEFEVPAIEQNEHPYYGLSLASSLKNSNGHQASGGQPSTSDALYSREDNECDFFTKQAKLQIETRMALAQAKNMAHRQMEIERYNQRISPITAVIRGSLDTIGISCLDDKRRVSRQMLTNMNIAQLQILLNNLHAHIEKLNESLVNHLMERDDLHVGQDAMLVDIEELTRYIGAKEQIVQQQRRLSFFQKFSK